MRQEYTTSHFTVTRMKSALPLALYGGPACVKSREPSASAGCTHRKGGHGRCLEIDRRVRAIRLDGASASPWRCIALVGSRLHAAAIPAGPDPQRSRRHRRPERGDGVPFGRRRWRSRSSIEPVRSSASWRAAAPRRLCTKKRCRSREPARFSATIRRRFRRAPSGSSAGSTFLRVCPTLLPRRCTALRTPTAGVSSMWRMRRSSISRCRARNRSRERLVRPSPDR